MNRGRATISFALLCTFAFCASAAQGASAQVGTQSTNTTAVTCVLGSGNEDFADSHCDNKVNPGEGSYGHVAISNNTTTEIEVSQVGTLKFNVPIPTPMEITCNKVASVAGKSFIHNVEIESKKHTVTGTVQLNVTECTVVKPAKCVVKEPMVTTFSAVGVEGLNGKNEMGIEFVGEGEEQAFVELTFENKGAEKCALVNGGKPFRVKGSMIATGSVAQGSKQSGATWVFEDKNEMETLELGLTKASLAATLTPSMAGGGNPIALTTVT